MLSAMIAVAHEVALSVLCQPCVSAAVPSALGFSQLRPAVRKAVLLAEGEQSKELGRSVTTLKRLRLSGTVTLAHISYV